eukprot:TRINITY_DN3406_c0_g1_i12.p1 TRINITY_DN3406_c0_g1~~TRINITY_DN3406_c0_g1_i12.p1  ORF type:complete len:435 (+),score=81.72 TRINITY_DN3406_c0_g1_i12:201-1505(+)
MEEFKVPSSPALSQRSDLLFIRTKTLTQQNIIYFSVFDLESDEWRIEHEVIKDYSNTLRNKHLGQKWLDELNAIAQKNSEESKEKSLKENAWDIILEYILLHKQCLEISDARIKNLQAYLVFYHLVIHNPSKFTSLMKELVKHLEAAADASNKFRRFELEYRQHQREQQYRSLKPLYKLLLDEKIERKTNPVHYVLGNNIVTPLLFTKMVVEEEHTAEEGSSVISTDASFRKEASGVHVVKAVQDKEKAARKSTLSTQKVMQQNADMFTPGALSAILIYINFKQGNDIDMSKYIVVGYFAVAMWEVTASELRQVHELVGARMLYNNINMRLVRPFKPVYSLFMRVALIFGVHLLDTVDFKDFASAVRSHMGAAWRPELVPAARLFLKVSQSLKGVARRRDLLSFMERVKDELMKKWQTEIVRKSFTFTQATSSS